MTLCTKCNIVFTKEELEENIIHICKKQISYMYSKKETIPYQGSLIPIYSTDTVSMALCNACKWCKKIHPILESCINKK